MSAHPEPQQTPDPKTAPQKAEVNWEDLNHKHNGYISQIILSQNAETMLCDA
jgi:hypothetical protein